MPFKIVVILSLFCNILFKGQNTNEVYLKSFLQDIANNHLSNSDVIDKYICSVSKANNDNKQNEIHKLITAGIDSLRKKISKGLIKNITIKKYLDLPPSEQKILCDTASMKDIFVVYLQDKILISVLFKGNKIASFITLHKGESGKKFFMEFCYVEKIKS